MPQLNPFNFKITMTKQLSTLTKRLRTNIDSPTLSEGVQTTRREGEQFKNRNYNKETKPDIKGGVNASQKEGMAQK